MDLQKQIDYWSDGSASDIETAAILIEKTKFREGMFFCHLAVEKLLKAVYVKNRSELAPKSHNLFMLLEKSEISIDKDKEDFFGILMKFQIHGRYPEPGKLEYPENVISDFFIKTKGALEWLQKML